MREEVGGDFRSAESICGVKFPPETDVG